MKSIAYKIKNIKLLIRWKLINVSKHLDLDRDFWKRSITAVIWTNLLRTLVYFKLKFISPDSFYVFWNISSCITSHTHGWIAFKSLVCCAFVWIYLSISMYFLKDCSTSKTYVFLNTTLLKLLLNQSKWGSAI